MKTLKINSFYKKIIKWLLMPLMIVILAGLYSCEDEKLLDQTALSDLTDDAIFSSKAGFEMSLSGLVYNFREEWQQDDKTYWTQFQYTDMYTNWDPEEKPQGNDWSADFNSQKDFVENYWSWAYEKMIPMANKIINFAPKDKIADIWDNEAEMNAVIAEAKFFRAWTYNILANLFGDAVIIDDVLYEAKFDFQRSPRIDVYKLAKEDLEFAAKWLPLTVDKSKEGRIVRAAAQHLLTEVCISLGDYDEAIASATDLIGSGLYHLMRERFGSSASNPGDVFSDLFKDGNFNRSSGNMESILVWQITENVEGGIGSNDRGNNFVRGFAPFLVNFKDKYGQNGWVYDPTVEGADTAGRGAGFVRPSNYSLYDIWQEYWDDMRNSKYNMRREFYFNNPSSSHYGEKWDDSCMVTLKDTARRVYAYSLKVEGPFFQGGEGDYKGRTRKDVYVMRLAETYLLRAEAYIRKGGAANLQLAADDINEVRGRANIPDDISAGQATIDFILDERARELMTEEPRTRTLIRMGKLVERVRLYDIEPVSRATVAYYNKFWPIPQSAIDENTGAVLRQNEGYEKN